MGLENTFKTWRRRRSDEKLFRQLCDAHQLRAEQRRLLGALADRYRLVRISEIFVRPSLFTASPDRGSWSDQKVSELRDILFAEIAAATTTNRQPAPSAATPTNPIAEPDRVREPSSVFGKRRAAPESAARERGPARERGQERTSTSGGNASSPIEPPTGGTASGELADESPTTGPLPETEAAVFLVREVIDDPAIDGAVPTVRE